MADVHLSAAAAAWRRTSLYASGKTLKVTEVGVVGVGVGVLISTRPSARSALKS